MHAGSIIWLSFARFGTSLLLFVVCDIFNPDNIIQYTNQTVVRLGQTSSQEHLGAPIYWSPKILFSTFWKGMKRKSYDKTRFCVSHEGLSNGLGTFGLTWYMFENKTKNMFLIWRGSNVLEPRLQYNGARAPIYWSHQFFFPIRQ